MVTTQVERIKKDIRELEYSERKLMKSGEDTRAWHVRQKILFMKDSLEELNYNISIAV